MQQQNLQKKWKNSAPFQNSQFLMQLQKFDEKNLPKKVEIRLVSQG